MTDKDVESKKIVQKKIMKDKKWDAIIGSNGQFSPCCGCKIRCIPATCDLLDKWLI